jgi:hypothetical protein
MENKLANFLRQWFREFCMSHAYSSGTKHIKILTHSKNRILEIDVQTIVSDKLQGVIRNPFAFYFSIQWVFGGSIQTLRFAYPFNQRGSFANLKIIQLI